MYAGQTPCELMLGQCAAICLRLLTLSTNCNKTEGSGRPKKNLSTLTDLVCKLPRHLVEIKLIEHDDISCQKWKLLLVSI